jgi:hypothetical protein
MANELHSPFFDGASFNPDYAFGMRLHRGKPGDFCKEERFFKGLFPGVKKTVIPFGKKRNLKMYSDDYEIPS